MKIRKLTFLYCIILFACYGVRAQTYLTVSVTQPPTLVADAGKDDSICLGNSIIIGGSPSATGGTAPVTYAWSPLGGSAANPIIAPTASGNYVLSLTDPKGCTSADTIYVKVNIPPTAAFSESSLALVVNFTDLSGSGIATWLWDFGDGATSPLANPTHTYATDSTYTVCLTVTDSAGCSDTTCKSVIVLPVGVEAPEGSFTWNVSPNPFSDWTDVNYSLKKSEAVKMEVYDLSGKFVLAVFDGSQSAGDYTLRLGDEKHPLPSGVWMLRMQIGESVSTKRILKIR